MRFRSSPRALDRVGVLPAGREPRGSASSAAGRQGRTVPTAAQVEFFEANIRPVLIDTCGECHTDDEEGDLRTDSRAALLKGGENGPGDRPRRSREEPADSRHPPRRRVPADAEEEAEAARQRRSRRSSSGSSRARHGPTTSAGAGADARPRRRAHGDHRRAARVVVVPAARASRAARGEQRRVGEDRHRSLRARAARAARG